MYFQFFVTGNSEGWWGGGGSTRWKLFKMELSVGGRTETPKKPWVGWGGWGVYGSVMDIFWNNI